MLRLAPVLLIWLAVWTSGCATVVRGNTDTVYVDADRDSAYVFVDGVPAGVAPARLQMKRSANHTVEVVRSGFRIEEAGVYREFSPAAGAGALLGGLGGVLIDATSGAIYDLEPGQLRFVLVPDSAGTDAARVAQFVQRARLAAQTSFAEADPDRRRAPPWWTAQVASGVFGGVYRPASDDADIDTEETVAGLAASLSVGARTETTTARLRVIAAQGIFKDDAERWEVAALLGLITESPGGRLRASVAVGPGLSGGRTSAACIFGCRPDFDPPRESIPTRVGLAGEADAFAFITPQIGFGLTVPVNYSLRDNAYGLLVGIRVEGL